MDTDAASRASSPQPGTSRRRVTFPEGHGKTLAQLYEWFMVLHKQHSSLEPLMKEGRHRPYLTVNPQLAVYNMLVKEGFLGLTMTPANPDAQQQMVIIHGVSAAINVDLLSTPEAFLWLKRRIIAGEPRPQLLGLVEGAMPSSVHLHGLGRFRVGLYTTEPDLCGHCYRFGQQSWKCELAPRCSLRERGTFVRIRSSVSQLLNHQQNSCGKVTGTTFTPSPSKPILSERASSSRPTRREEVVLARLRMVCILPTHILPYIAKTFPPQCSTCNVTLSVEHILLHCMRYRKERRPLVAYIRGCGLLPKQTTLLGDKHPDVFDRLMIYLTEINLIK
ncbi:hypothetical protein E2C01_085199 [Portunus trituberculatus]|uniref:Uncharacterized protein n=1 Tax=Portunus trituberculatus TaxID=210409 RepID=A0A5B7J621_PORTR|nr:hypothetical protein [Portunus trituberculatus]